MFKIISKIAAGAFLFLAFASIVKASATDVSIRLSQPKSPTNQNSININFVTLDTQNRAITVKCFKKSPADAGFSQFGADIALAPGGNTGNCSTAGVISTEGTYQFQATATADADTAASNLVSVDYNTSGPGTPTNYSKEKPSSCVYRIKFKTAEDSGKTVKVEVYRSENTSFNADSGTRVATVSIGSNTEGSADITSPDCPKEYFFAVRAFDSAGNGSGVIGDSITIVTTTTQQASPTPQTGGAIPANNSQISRGGPAILGEKTGETEGQVEATSDAKPEPSPIVSPSPSPKPKSQDSLFSTGNLAIGGAVLLLVVVIGFLFFRPKNNPPMPPQTSEPPIR